MMNDTDDEKFTSDLLRAAGPRPRVPDEDFAAIRDAAHAAWRARYARPARRWRPRRLVFGIAATLLLGISVAILLSNRVSPVPAAPAPVVVASVERAVGTALVPGQSLLAGALIETGNTEARLVVRLAGGESLRLDGEKRARLVAAALVELECGALYVDSTTHAEFAIRTAAGLFTPVGTQFEVRVGAEGTRLRVREGRVAFRRERSLDMAEEGEDLSIAIDGTVTRGTVRADDAVWQWAADTAPLPVIEGRTLAWFLQWYAREKGLKLRYDDGSVATLASTTTLHGSLGGLTLDAAAGTVALSTGVRVRIRDGVLVVIGD